MRPMRERETQRGYVERVLRTDGHISAYGAMYELRDEQGHPRSITRLAAIIEPLRKDGWGITTRGGHGELATYVVTNLPAALVPKWQCVACGAVARLEPTPLLGGMAEAYCFPCHQSRLFSKSTGAVASIPTSPVDAKAGIRRFRRSREALRGV